MDALLSAYRHMLTINTEVEALAKQEKLWKE